MVKIAIFIILAVLLIAFLGSNLSVITSLFSSFDYILTALSYVVDIVGEFVVMVTSQPYTMLVLGAFIVTYIITYIIGKFKE